MNREPPLELAQDTAEKLKENNNRKEKASR